LTKNADVSKTSAVLQKNIFLETRYQGLLPCPISSL